MRRLARQRNVRVPSQFTPLLCALGLALQPLTVRELTMGQLEWIQMLVDGLNGYIVRGKCSVSASLPPSNRSHSFH